MIPPTTPPAMAPAFDLWGLLALPLELLELPGEGAGIPLVDEEVDEEVEEGAAGADDSGALVSESRNAAVALKLSVVTTSR